MNAIVAGFCLWILVGLSITAARAGQVPGAAEASDIAVSHHDRVYAAEQFSNTVSVIDPADNRLLGVIRLGEPQPANFSPLYRGQLLVHGLGASPDHHTLAVVSVGSNSVSFIDTQTNLVKHVAYIGRSPHEAFFTKDGSELWVTVRGENYIQILDGTTYEEKSRIVTPNGPGMTIFSPDGSLAYICSSFVAELDVFETQGHRQVGKVVQSSPFCPNIAASPDGSEVWFTLKDTGKTTIIAARPPFTVLKILDTGPITNHVNIVRNRNGQFAYVSVGGLNEVQVFRTGDYVKVATIPVGNLPHGEWPSGDGTRLYVGLENSDRMAVIDTLANRVVADIPIGQAPQAVMYVPTAVGDNDAGSNLRPLEVAGQAAHLTLRSASDAAGVARSSVSLFDQGLVQVLQAAVTGLEPKTPYVFALARHADGGGDLQSLVAFTTNAAGAAIVDTTGPIRQLVQSQGDAPRRYLVIAAGTAEHPAKLMQVQQ